MELVSYNDGGSEALGFAVAGKIYNCKQVHPQLPDKKEGMLREWKRYAPLAKLMYTALVKGDIKRHIEFHNVSEIQQIERICEVSNN